jgi:TPR repeat protein
MAAMLIATAIGVSATPPAHASALGRATAAYSRGDYPRAARELSVLAAQGNARAQGLLGFLYEHGFGVPQAYDAAADLYAHAAVQGNPFAQAMLGLMYDKGHGVPRDVILAYKWLDLAAARTRGKERDAYARFRDALASKMSPDEIAVGQRLALNWTPGAFVQTVQTPQ